MADEMTDASNREQVIVCLRWIDEQRSWRMLWTQHSKFQSLSNYHQKGTLCLKKLKSNLSPGVPGFHTLCPTRWTVRGSSFRSVAQNYGTLQELWYESKDLTKDTEMKARIIRVESQMKTFNYLFGILLAERILTPADRQFKQIFTENRYFRRGRTVFVRASCQNIWIREEYRIVRVILGELPDIRQKRFKWYSGATCSKSKEETTSIWRKQQQCPLPSRCKRPLPTALSVKLWTPSETVLKTDSINQATRRTNDFSNSFSKPPTARIMKQNWHL